MKNVLTSSKIKDSVLRDSVYLLPAFLKTKDILRIVEDRTASFFGLGSDSRHLHNDRHAGPKHFFGPFVYGFERVLIFLVSGEMIRLIKTLEDRLT